MMKYGCQMLVAEGRRLELTWSQVRKKTGEAVRIATVLIPIVLLVFVAWPGQSVVAQTTVVNITSYRVDGAANYNAPGNESFWKDIGWTNVPLGASVTPGGGNTSSVLVKSANDGFNIYILMRWNDGKGPSYGASPEAYMWNGKFKLLYYQNTSLVKQLFYNSTYYYPDRVAMLWFLGGPQDIVPKMQLNSTGAITSGSANIWHWQSNPTDNNPSDTGYAGNYTDPKGKLIFPPNNSSFAEDDYTDKTGFYPISGNVSISPSYSLNLDPYGNPFMVLAGNYFSNTNKTWTVEMVRPLTVSQDLRYRVQLFVGSKYFVGFAVWNGRMGESQHIKSVSQWYSLTVSNQSPQSSPAPAAGVGITLVVATASGLLIAGLIIGVVVRPEKKKPGV